jgi:hypothetical protein
MNASDKKIKYLLMLIKDLYVQGCYSKSGTDGKNKYDHCCISTYEEAQELLLREGIIDQNEVARNEN